MELQYARYKNEHKPKQPSRLKPVMLILTALLMLAASYTALALYRDPPVPILTAVALPGRQASPVQLPWPASGQAAIGSLDDGLLAASGANELPAPMASLTKVITALVILDKVPYEAGSQGQSYTLTGSDAALASSYSAKNGVVLPVRSGQTITQHQEMQAMLISSANNIADSLAVHVFGSVDAYVTQANDFVKSKGLSRTVVADASGFSAQSISTPSELVLLGRLALQDTVIRSIVSQKEADLGDFGKVKTTNGLLAGQGVIGIKTGTTDEAGSCLLFASVHELEPAYKVTLIGVITGGTSAGSVIRDARALLAAASAQFSKAELAKAGTTAGTLTVSWGGSSNIVLSEDLAVYAWKGKAISPTVKLELPDNLGQAAQAAGYAEAAGSTSSRVQLVTSQALGQPPWLWRLRHAY